MGDFRVLVEAVGGHGCQREKKDGEVLEQSCGEPTCPDCRARQFVTEIKALGCHVTKATLTHWPKDHPNYVGNPHAAEQEVRDDLLTGRRSGSF